MHILIVDDDPDIVAMLVRYLVGKGHQVESSVNGEEALQLIKGKPYDLIFLDFNMPELTGFELVAYIEKNKIQTKTVMITGYANMREFFAKFAGVDEYLQKPFQLKDIGAIVEKYEN